MEITDLRLGDGYMAWVDDYEKADEQERGLITDLVNAIAHGLRLVGTPECVLEVREYNCQKKLATMRFTLGKTDTEGGLDLNYLLPLERSFKTAAKQSYHARNRDNPNEDYDGKLEVSVLMMGVQDSRPGFYNPNEIAEVILKLACGYYYEKICQHYPEWNTDYADAPILETYPINRTPPIPVGWGGRRSSWNGWCGL